MRTVVARHRRGERGAAAVEFALVVPFLILIMLGIVNFGAVIAQQLALSNAARQAARYAVTDGPDCSRIESEARDAVATVGMPKTAPTFTMTGGGCPKPCTGSATRADQNVTVTMKYNSSYIVPFPIPGFPSSVNLEGKGQFRCEFS
jgi:Flp pilus assembly protein TadG